jgi:TonB family protein
VAAGGMLERFQFPAGELGPDPVTVFTLRQLTPEQRAAMTSVQVDTVVMPARDAAGAEGIEVPAFAITGSAETVAVPATAVAPSGETVITTTTTTRPGTATVITGTSSTRPGTATVVTGTSSMRPGTATVVTGTSSMRPGTATVVTGTASTRPGAATVVTGTASTRPGAATVVTTTTSTRPAQGATVSGTASTRPARGTVVAPGTATTRPAEGVVVPGSAAPRDTVPVSVVNPDVVSRALRQEYPAQLRAAGIEGSATLELRVAADGSLAGTRVIESSHPAFGPAAARAVAAARFRPARHRGTDVASTILIPLQFHLDRGSTPPLTSARQGSRGAMSTAAAAAGRTYDQPPVPTNVADITRALNAEYPPMLRAAGIAADAQVLVRVGTSGQVLAAEAVEASHPEAAAAAARVLSGARFRPARKDGRAVEAEVVLPVQFRLDTGTRP